MFAVPVVFLSITGTLGLSWPGDSSDRRYLPAATSGLPASMTAAVFFGYADESPGARPRKPLSEVARWV